MTADAFEAYDFEGDERWRKYFSSIEVPSGDKQAVEERLKRKWYQRNVDPDSYAATAGAQAAKPEPTAAAAAAKGAAQGGLGGAGRGVLRGVGQHPAVLLFGLHLAQLVLAAGVLLPVRAWGARPWQLFQLAAFAAHGVKTVLKHGWPQRSMPALQAYAASAMPSTDFQYMLMALMLLASRPMALAILPTITLALYHAMAYAAGKLGHTAMWPRTGGRAHAWLLARQAKALEVNAFAEVGTGFLLVLALFTAHRSILLTFYYWKNFLPLRYWSPDSAACHRQAWAVIQQYAAPVLRAVPLLNYPIRAVGRWFVPPQ
ncbi:hypothetical protein WJX81_006381 [Elliptochloris bilobata]|uniref:Uncharacterized protein n=1 Tax=Elliptochloris bilobata TaxID=381761 RepID=A0AAW1RFI3_9CHLO